uniref:Uncharacterized protein n=1 Tax=Neobodo designis TaxID=312471 RepID=A0A7S1W369_NEODS
MCDAVVIVGDQRAKVTVASDHDAPAWNAIDGSIGPVPIGASAPRLDLSFTPGSAVEELCIESNARTVELWAPDAARPSATLEAVAVAPNLYRIAVGQDALAAAGAVAGATVSLKFFRRQPIKMFLLARVVVVRHSTAAADGAEASENAAQPTTHRDPTVASGESTAPDAAADGGLRADRDAGLRVAVAQLASTMTTSFAALNGAVAGLSRRCESIEARLERVERRFGAETEPAEGAS